MEVDTTNKWLIGTQFGTGDFVFIRPVPQRLTKQDGLLLAAWLVSMAADDEAWDRTLKAVQNS